MFCISDVIHVHQSSQSIKTGHRKHRTDTVEHHNHTCCIQCNKTRNHTQNLSPSFSAPKVCVWLLQENKKQREGTQSEKRKAGKKRMHSLNRSNKQQPHTHTHTRHIQLLQEEEATHREASK